jgi:general secretion pathway protein G
MLNNKRAFTMIELIFVIVIIGIVAAIGVPKLAVARNDASASVIATRLSNCIELASKGYLMDGSFDVNDSNCVEVVSIVNCYILTPSDENGTLNVQDVDNASNSCKSGQEITLKNKLSSSTGVTHSF